MSNIFFNPWIGSDFSDGGIFGKKVLVVGNSHYCKSRNECKNCGVDGGCFDYDCFGLTTDVVKKYLEGKEFDYWMNTYRKFERSLCGYETSNEDSEKIWNSLAFYNYLQTAVSSHDDPGSDKNYVLSEKAFFEVLEELQPDIVFVWGDRAWNLLPWNNYTAKDDCSYDGYSYSCGDYKLVSENKIPVYKVQHPSSNFSWEWWNNYFKANDLL